MDKRQLIEQIKARTSGFEARFLQRFTTRQLQEFIDRLNAAATRQMKVPGWSRRSRRRLAS